MRTRRSPLAVALTLAAITAACRPSGAWSEVDGIVLTVPPCDDGAACAEEYVFEGERYTAGPDVTADVVTGAEVARHTVAEPDGIDVLVTTADPGVIYLRASGRWFEATAPVPAGPG